MGTKAILTGACMRHRPVSARQMRETVWLLRRCTRFDRPWYIFESCQCKVEPRTRATCREYLRHVVTMLLLLNARHLRIFHRRRDIYSGRVRCAKKITLNKIASLVSCSHRYYRPADCDCVYSMRAFIPAAFTVKQLTPPAKPSRPRQFLQVK
jgi:hypothetical protein